MEKYTSIMFINHRRLQILLVEFLDYAEIFKKMKDHFPEWKLHDDVVMMMATQDIIETYKDDGYTIEKHTKN